MANQITQRYSRRRDVKGQKNVFMVARMVEHDKFNIAIVTRNPTDFPDKEFQSDLVEERLKTPFTMRGLPRDVRHSDVRDFIARATIYFRGSGLVG